MELTLILFWIVTISAFSTFIAAIARRPAADGWITVTFIVLITLLVAKLMHSDRLVYVATGLWALLVVVPSLLARKYHKHLLQQEYAAALPVCRAISFLHPFDGWREQPRIVQALNLAHRGDITQAVEILKQFQHVTSPAAQTAIINLYRITNRWEEFLAWINQLPANQRTNASVIPVLLRAHGETGDLRSMIQIYRDNRAEIAKLMPATNRDFCRLMLFAFAGRRDLVERLFGGPLSLLPNPSKGFWIATAQLTGGEPDLARHRFETLLPTADPSTRRAIERRLSFRLPTADSLDPAHMQIVEQAAIEHGHEEVFHAAPPLMSGAARATLLLIVINVIVFAFEIIRGGATNGEVLMRMGAMYPPAVRSGEWWRLLTATFLHFGAAHVMMNMFGLAVLGPFVEFAFGFIRFLAIYLVAGVGSMFIVMKLAGPHGHGILVGASGSIMGLVGATGGIMLKGWMRQKASPAKRRLRTVLTILVLQTMFDAMIPQVSMSAHLSGALIGFVVALLLPNKLIAESR